MLILRTLQLALLTVIRSRKHIPATGSRSKGQEVCRVGAVLLVACYICTADPAKLPAGPLLHPGGIKSLQNTSSVAVDDSGKPDKRRLC